MNKRMLRKAEGRKKTAKMLRETPKKDRPAVLRSLRKYLPSFFARG